MRALVSALLIGALMFLCFAGTVSCRSVPEPTSNRNVDIAKLWYNLAKALKTKGPGSSHKQWLESSLERFLPDGSSDMKTVPCSHSLESVNSWNLTITQGEDDSVSIIIKLMIDLACKDRDFAYGFAHPEPILCPSEDVIDKSSLLFVASGQQNGNRSEVGIGYIQVRTKAYLQTLPDADDEIQDSLSDYHSQWALDHIPPWEDDCVEAEPESSINLFKKINHEKHHQHRVEKQAQYNTDDKGVVAFLGEHLDECYSSMGPQYTINRWRDCEAYFYDFAANTFIFECESVISKRTRDGARQGCERVMTNITYIQAAVRPNANKMLDVQVIATYDGSDVRECGKDLSTNATTSHGSCFHFHTISSDVQFKPAQLLSSWSHLNNSESWWSSGKLNDFNPVSSVSCHVRAYYSTKEANTKANWTIFVPNNTIINSTGSDNTRTSNTRPPRRSRAINMRHPDKANIVEHIGQVVSTQRMEIVQAITSYTTTFISVLEKLKSKSRTTEYKHHCFRLTASQSNAVAAYYDGIDQPALDKIVPIITGNIKPPQNSFLASVGLKYARGFHWESEVQIYKGLNGSQKLMYVIKSRNAYKNSQINLAYATLAIQSDYAQDQVVVRQHHSILGGLYAWDVLCLSQKFPSNILS